MMPGGRPEGLQLREEGHMRVLLSTIGSRGDVEPLVALATELKAQEHDARLCVPPDFRDWIESLGFPVTPIGPEVKRAGASRPPPGAATAPPAPERLRQVIEATVATQFTTIAAAAEGCDVIVAATALQIAAPSVAETLGIGHVFAAYAPNVLPSPHHAPPPLPPAPGEPLLPATTDNRELWARNADRTNRTFRAALNERRASLGLGPVDDVRRYMFTEHPWLAADPTLAPWPDPGDPAVFQTGAWILPNDRALPGNVEAFLDAGEPPVLFGFGSMHTAPDLGQTMLAAARAVGRRAIVSQGWAGLSAVENAPDCLPIGEVNFQALFPRVAAVVHHGGAGTTTVATLTGAPQIIAPQIYDQHYFARRIQELGVGIAHPPGTPTSASLTDALDGALRPEVAARAKSVATKVRRDGARVAVQRLMGARV